MSPEAKELIRAARQLLIYKSTPKKTVSSSYLAQLEKAIVNFEKSQTTDSQAEGQDETNGFA